MTELTIAAPAASVSASLHGSGGTCLALGHGAGGDRRTPFLVRYAEAIAASGRTALLFNFPYSERRRKVPDAPRVLEDTVAAVALAARERSGRVVLGGKSMGGRIASQAVAQGVACDGLVFLGYPLHPPGQPDRRRDAHLPRIAAPMLFLQGTRDAFARWDLIEGVVAGLGERARLLRMDEADHSFAVPRKTSLGAADVERRLVEETVRWLEARGL
ncbi:MAG TPA: alpha/beta family hydrolase [Vicinamibacteria bacterium]|nr:alpha/beta family hydrolase [Vicinamibacteria bacterium]